MKKLKKSFMSLILFLIYTNNIYATTTGHYTVSEKNNEFGKIFLLIVGIGLISLVLFIGYMMDKNENTRKKREKFIKKQSGNDIYANNYKTKKIDEWVEQYKINTEEKEASEDNYNEEDEEDDEEIEDKDVDIDDNSNYYTQEIKLTNENDKEEEDEIESLKDFERNLIEKYIDADEDDEEDDDEVENDAVEETYDEENENDENEETEEIIIEDNSFDKPSDILELMNSTMVFNSNELKNEENNKNSVKGYDFEEDDDLSELESIIKAANIKRYTRKKNRSEEQIKPKKKVVIFKKTKNDSDIIAQTRKKIDELKESQKPKRGRKPGSKNKNKEEKIEETVEKVPAKRGRKPGSKNKPKEPAKRGRKPGSKNKTTAKKRGRPAKEDSEKKSKRGRPAKKAEE